ncbi:MAG: hypothetical protein GF383_00550 [Candidatus Lokiarchaeota archaeon]|nr:hypothetical protein [Candidatus Lokiarchaeota archaeon]MBD3337648.1 hypothetical protein [Candidatus Lokiarchaeota archaeon]
MPNTKIDKKKSKKQSYIMSLRLDEDTYQKIDAISKEKNINKSELLRNSFNEWVNLKEVLIKSDTMLIGKNLLKGLLNFANEHEIRNLAKDIAKVWLNEFNIHIIDKKAKKDLDSMLLTFKDGIGPSEANWFEKVNYVRTDKNSILIYGIHSLNYNFSLFVKSFLEYLMKKQFKFVLNQESSNISDTTIRIDFQLSEN